MLDHVIAVERAPGHPAVMISGVQIKMARTALGWSAATLATRARLGTATVQRAESAEVPPITVGNLFAIQRALEEGGVMFIEDGQQSLAGGPGVRLRRP
jgi:transcriptional regulator with XRE-family HTH domain